MLSNQYFYYQLTRKYVILFGTLFNNITMKRIDRQTNTEIERVKVPIIYAPKEKYIARLLSDLDLSKSVQILLPRMSFDISGISYDASRKQNSLLRQAKGDTSTRVKSQYMGVPYDLDFELNIYSRNIDDGTHIVEQILPYFVPDYTITMNPISDIGFLKDIPIILNSVENSVEHEGNFDAVRYVVWTLRFTMKVHYFGPITQPKIIREIDVNIYNDPSLKSGYITRLNLDEGNNGTFKISDTIYQGPSYKTASAFATVSKWDSTNNTIELVGTQGQFIVNNTIRATSTNAAYKIESFDASPLKLVNINIVPDPTNAEPEDDYGYTTTITEWPNL